jgi:hypothetical protein
VDQLRCRTQHGRSGLLAARAARTGPRLIHGDLPPFVIKY